ncbi:MAG: hypothetical protein FI734_01395 [SAR202 cluster bacterium]|nr:hypothetical protein [SAR202 cluster bacterium]|tara:strand:+ start:412 stop:954 length:543 start_codon:yes stop_codon:yes gene_type:complete
MNINESAIGSNQGENSSSCRHLYLRRGTEGIAASCIHCNMHFRLAWTSTKKEIVRPATRNLILAFAGVALLVASQLLGLQLGAFPISSIFLMIAVLFFTRAVLGGFELWARHGFIPGILGPIVRRNWLNPLPPKPYITTLSSVRFPIDLRTYRLFEPGDTLLIEHLRWSRLPVAIYKGGN